MPEAHCRFSSSVAEKDSATPVCTCDFFCRKHVGSYNTSALCTSPSAAVVCLGTSSWLILSKVHSLCSSANSYKVLRYLRVMQRNQAAERSDSDTARTPDGPFCMLPAPESLSGSNQSKGTQSKTRVSRLFKSEHTVTFRPLACVGYNPIHSTTQQIP